MRSHICSGSTYVCLAVLFCNSISLAQTDTKSKALSEFYRGYYLQNEHEDPEAAIKAYKRSIAQGADKKLRQQIDNQIALLQEDLAVSDFAQLMPANSIAYVEFNRPGSHLERLATAMGITGERSEKAERVVLRLDDEVHIPSDFKLSPALLRELNKVRGAAIAVTEIGQRRPTAVAIIHPGDSDLLTGLVETGVQFVPENEKIGGFPTFRIEDEIWFVKTARLIIASTDASLIEDCIGRIRDSEIQSIADTKEFQSARQSASAAAVFAYVQPKLALSKMGRQLGRDFAIARMILDLDHIDYVTAAITTSAEGIHFNANVTLDEKHNSLAYGMLRTVPLSRKALDSVPSGSAAVAGMGLNPKLLLAAESHSERRLTGLDIGREMFANIEELALFVLPSIADRPASVPDFGLVIASNDTDKSEALWHQLLEIPAMLESDSGKVTDVQISGVDAKAYQLPEKNAPEIIICRLNADSMVAGTKAAVQAAVNALQNGNSLAKDSKATRFNSSIREETAKVVYAHVGRCLQLASQVNRGNDASQMRMISHVVEDMNVAILMDEGETRLGVRTDISGLPQFESVIRSLAQMRNKMNFTSNNRERSTESYEHQEALKSTVLASPSDESIDE